jgi:AcrR family transcriptional regulator
MKAVAAHLGTSVPGLYHHVRNRKELLLLAAERSLSRVRLPEDRGQHWSVWLREWARYSRRALVDDPEIFRQFLSGAVSWDQMIEVADSVIQVLNRQGFSPAEAMSAWEAVGRCAIGSVVQELRARAATEAGRPPLAELLKLLDDRPSETYPSIRAALRSTVGHDARFEDDLSTVLAGIAVRRGEPWEVTQ